MPIAVDSGLDPEGGGGTSNRRLEASGPSPERRESVRGGLSPPLIGGGSRGSPPELFMPPP